MRTTLSIDDDVLAAAKALAERQRKTIGEVVSELARKALQPAKLAQRRRNGVPLFPVRKNSGPVTMELINRLRDESP